ncbi:hypothetical protein D3C80_1108830 [compost metagenome]
MNWSASRIDARSSGRMPSLSKTGLRSRLAMPARNSPSRTFNRPSPPSRAEIGTFVSSAA